jgi:glycosyltransferase involved in cell wall biosynthesis
MKEFRPHIVHTRNFGALDGILSAHMTRVPVTIHSEHGYELDILGGLPLRRRFVCRALYPMADAIFTVTEDLRAYHSRQSWMPSTKFRVIHNGVDTDRFSPAPETTKKNRVALGLPPGRMVVGTVGRLVPIKDHETLLRAAELLLHQGKNLHVLIVGSGPEQAKLEAIVASSAQLNGHVTFAGASDHVPEMLNAIDVFVLPSISEGMSNTTLEAMACGLPVVVTRTGGNPELTDDGRSGGLFVPRDFKSLAQILAGFHSDRGRRDAFGAAARRRAVEKFSLAGMVQNYRELYLELAARRGFRKPN